MTDTTAPRPLKVFTCFNPRKPTESCYGLVEDADEPRRLHREWHKHEEAVKEGYRRTIVKNAEDAFKAIGARDEEIAALRQEIVDLGRDVTGIEIPQPVLGIEINRDGYTDDEDEEPAAVADATVSDPQAVADAVAAFTDPSEYPLAIDRPDEPISPYGATGTVF